jgi:hypothetical protein
MSEPIAIQLVVFDADDTRLRQLATDARHLDYIEFVGGTGPAVTNKNKARRNTCYADAGGAFWNRSSFSYR